MRRSRFTEEQIIEMLNPTKEGANHMQITALGIDLAKSVFQPHGVDAVGAVVLQKKLRRGTVLGFLVSWSPV